MAAPNAHESLYKRLPELMGEIARLGQSLLETLQEERTALDHRDHEAITRAAAQKSGLVKSLEQIEAERIALVSAAGYDVSESGFCQCLTAVDSGGQIALHWRETLETLTACQQQNLTNGAIVDASQHFLEHALGILRGSPASSQTYDTHGRTKSSLPPRHLAQV